MFTHTEIKPNVDLFTEEGKEIYVVGTAHISSQSVDLVQETIDEVLPETVAVELCDGRLKSLKDPDRWKNTNLVTIIRQGKAHILLAQLLLAGYQKKLGKNLSIKPGAEMLAAVKIAEEQGRGIVLADRDINVTLKRTWASLGLIGLMKLSFSTLKSLVDKDGSVTEEEIERLKSADALAEVMKEFSEALPQVRTALIDERDAYLTELIRTSPGKKVVAVVGAAHVPGIKRLINSPIDLAAISSPPQPSLLKKVVGWSVPLLIVVGMVYSFATAGSETFTEMFKTWFWFTALFGAIGAAIVRAHPLTIVSAFIGAPFAALNPFIAAGWIAGLVEAMVRKPQVKDLESIVDDMATVSGMLRNRVSRTLVIVASTNLFVMAGMGVAGIKVYQIATEHPSATAQEQSKTPPAE
jgi:pheromone shutdown-related protein TraB